MLRRLRERLRPTAERTAPAPEDALETVREWVEAAVIGGFDTYATVRESVLELAADDGVDPATAERLLEQRWDARRAEQEGWASPSDADRLAAAFAELNDGGVLARMSFSCCGTCGPGELFEVRDAESPQPSYVFFHQQEAERVGDGQLFLSYGSFVDVRDRPDPEREYERLAVAVGEQVRATLTKHGLEVVWDGTLAKTIRVQVPDWRVPLPPRA